MDGPAQNSGVPGSLPHATHKGQAWIKFNASVAISQGTIRHHPRHKLIFWEPMVRILQPLSLGKILDETFNIYRSNLWLFIGISLVPSVVLLLLKLAVILSNLDPNNIVVSSKGIGLWIASLITESTITAATTFAVSDIYLERPTSISACFSRVAGKLQSVIYASIAVSLIVGFGTILCIVPGIYWAGVYGIAIPAVVLENITARQALSRSSTLTKNSVGRVIVIYFLTTIFVTFIVVAIRVGAGVFGAAASHIRLATVWQETVTTIGGILFGPITAIALTLAYYDQRVRNEALDIEHMMSMMNAPVGVELPPPIL